MAEEIDPYIIPGKTEEDPYLLQTPKGPDPQGMQKAMGSKFVHEGVLPLAGAAGDVIKYAGQAISGDQNWQPKGYLGVFPTSESLEKNVGSKLPKYEPQNIGEEYAGSIGAFLPAAMGGPEMWGARSAAEFGPAALKSVLQYGVAPGVASETAGQVARQVAPEYEPASRVIGGLTGPGVFSKAITRNPYSSATTAVPREDWENAVNILRGEAGINKGDLTVGQATNRPERLPSEGKAASTLLRVNSPERMNANVSSKFTRGALRYGGLNDAETGLPTNMRRMEDLNDAEFRRLGHYDMPLDRQLQTRFSQAARDYRSSNIGGNDSAVVDVIDKINDIGSRTGGFITGEQYNSFRSQLGSAMASASPHEARALATMRNALDDSMENAIRYWNPDDVGAWGRVRNQYRNELTLRRAVGTSAEGEITPESLANAIKVHGGTDDYVLGRHPMSAYARAGQMVLKPLPGTKEKSDEIWKLALLLGGGSYLGEKAGDTDYGKSHGLGGAVGTGVGLGLGGLLAALRAGRFARIPGTNYMPGQAFKSNQWFPPQGIAGAPASGLVAAEAIPQGFKRKEAPPAQ